MMQFRLKRYDCWPILLSCLFAISLIGGLWSVMLYQLGAARENHLMIAARDAENFAIAMQARTEREIERVDQNLVLMRYAYDEQGAGLNWGELMANGAIRTDPSTHYSVLGSDERVLLSSTPSRTGNLSGGDDALEHAGPGSERFLAGKQVAGSGDRAIRMTRRLNHADGSFKGAVVAAIDPGYFLLIHDSADLGRRDSIALIGGDGVIRARRKDGNDAIGQDVSDSPVLTTLLTSGQGTLRAVSAIDGVERIWAYRKLENQLLYVVVGFSVEDRLSSFTAMRGQMMALAEFATLVIVLFTGLQLWFIGRLCRSRERAMDESLRKTLFLSNMSHELRTPLNGILGYSEMLAGDLRNPEKRMFAQYIHDSGTHLLALVNSLLQISKIEAGQVALDVKREPLEPLLAAAINAHAGSAAVKGLILSLTMGPGLPLDLMCDRMRLMQVLNNLLHNAIKFTSAGKVELAVNVDPVGVRFSVLDTGPGIAPEFGDAIFDSFFQVQQNSMEGTGLGLAIAKQLLALMGGRLWLTSTPGHGAMFLFTLPLKP